MTTDETGVFTIKNGDLTILSSVGMLDNIELLDLISTQEKLTPIIKHTGGYIGRLHPDGKDNFHLPPFKLIQSKIRPSSSPAHSIVLKEATETRLINTFYFSIFSGFLALLACLLLLSSMWYRESR